MVDTEILAQVFQVSGIWLIWNLPCLIRRQMAGYGQSNISVGIEAINIISCLAVFPPGNILVKVVAAQSKVVKMLGVFCSKMPIRTNEINNC